MSSVSKSKRQFSVLHALAVGTLSVLSVFGCSNIVGLGDYTVGGSGGGAGHTSSSSGAPGEGGDNSAGEAGTSNAGTGAGGTTSAHAGSANGGGAGSAGTAGTAGTAGSAGSGALVGCDGKTAFAPSDSIVRSCILRGGCDPSFDPVRSISTCVTLDTQGALPGESCNLGSKTCTDYESCEHVGVAHDDLCGAGQVTRCQGTTAVNCGNYNGDDRFFDCAALGGGCGTYTYTNGKLYADCTMDVGNACTGQPDDDTSYFCQAGTAGSDDLRYYCWGGQAYGASCSSLGTCVDDYSDTGGGDATCYFNLQHCTTPATPTCNSNVVNDCSDNDLFKYDCSAVGLTCSTTGGDYCLAPGCTGDDVDNNCVESCSEDGSKLTFCYGGAPYTVKCADYGFTQCLTGTDDNGNPIAACRY